MATQRLRILCVLALAALVPPAVDADDRFKFNLVLDGRLVTTPETASFLDGGLGKTRYGHEPRVLQATLAQAALLGRFELRPDLTVRLHASVDAEHNFERRVDLVEALARYSPVLSDRVSLDIRAGLFFPSVSLENTDLAWQSPYTTTFSAINSWIGEEVRSLGVEAGPVLRIGNEAHARVFGAVTRANDPNGTLLAWRGFALHDRTSGFGDRLPLPALASFKPSGMFPDQPLHVQPLREVDFRWSWSAGATVTHEQYRLKALYQPPTANPAAFNGEQYAWRTGYWALGASRTLGPLEFLVQGLDGETRMGLASGNRNAVVARFQAAYVLASWAADAGGKHRTTLRYDSFRVRDRDDFKIEDPNDDSGTAWTFAYAYLPATRHRICVEVLRIDSTHANRPDLGLPPRMTEVLGTLSWRLTF